MNGYHFAATNPALAAWRRMLHRPGDVILGMVGVGQQTVGMAWDDEAGPHYLAFNELGRQKREKAMRALYGHDQAA